MSQVSTDSGHGEERKPWNRIALTTDNPAEAFAELRKRRARGEDGWDMADVRQLQPVLKTVFRYAVFQK